MNKSHFNLRHTGEFDSVKKVHTGCMTEKKLTFKMLSDRAVTKGWGWGISLVTIMEMNRQPVHVHRPPS